MIPFPQMLDELRAVRRAKHPDYLSYHISDIEVRFLADMVRLQRRGNGSGLRCLTQRQADWLKAIYERIMNEIKIARQVKVRRAKMSRYRIGY